MEDYKKLCLQGTVSVHLSQFRVLETGAWLAGLVILLWFGLL